MKESDVNTVILVNGKHYYELDNYRDSTEQKNVAIVRLESLCPFPIQELIEELGRYEHAKSKTYIFIPFWNVNVIISCSFYMESRRAAKYGSVELCQASLRKLMR